MAGITTITPQVLMDFSSTAYCGSPTFTDVTLYALAGLGFDPVTVTWGRQDQYSDITPTSTQVTFNTNDGRLTPAHTGLVSNLLPPEVASPGCVSGTAAAFVAGGGVTQTIDRSGTIPNSPTALKLAVGSGFTSGFGASLSTNSKVAVSASTQYTFACEVDGTNQGWRAEVIWYKADGVTQTGTSFGNIVPVGTLGYSTVTATSPALTAFFTWGVTPAANTTAAATVYAGNACLVAGASVVEETVSPYYPWVRRRAHGRLNLTANGTTVSYAEWFADSWEVVPSKEQPWLCNMSGTDILGRMAADSPLRGWLAEEAFKDSPSLLYALQEAEGSTAFGDLTGNGVPGSIANSSLGAGVVDVGQQPSSGLLFANVATVTNGAYSTWTTGGAAGSWLQFPLPAASVLSAGTHCEAWAQTLTTPPDLSATVIDLGSPTTAGLNVSLNVLGVPQATFSVGASSFSFGSSKAVCDGAAHLFAVAADTTNLYLWVDGVASSSAHGLTYQAPTGNIRLGMSIVSPFQPQAPFSGAFSYLSVYPAPLRTARVVSHYHAGSLASPEGGSPRTDQRVTTLLSYRSNYGSSLDTGLGNMGQQDISQGDASALVDGQGETLQQALFDAGDVERGVVYANGTSQVVMRSRSRLFNPTSVLTLDTSSSGVSLETTFRDDIQGMVNDETVTRTGGADNRYFNQASITQDGEAASTLTLDIDTDQNALSVAQWDVANGILDQLLIPGLVCNLLQLPAATVLALLQLQPLDCITITSLPAQAPSSTMTVQVQGGTLSLAVDAQTLTLNCTPLPPAVAVWDSTLWDSSPGWAF